MSTNGENSGHDYDFAVIGGGSAGYAAARTAAGMGLRTVVIDGAEELGGLCILRGCMPSKTLIHTANVALKARGAAEFGVRAAFQGVDTAAVRKRKRALIGEFADYRQGQLEDGRFALLRGTAAFTGPHELRVTLRRPPPEEQGDQNATGSGGGTGSGQEKAGAGAGEGGNSREMGQGGDEREGEGEGEGRRVLTVRAKSFLIATGSVIAWPEVPGLREAGVWTSDTALDAEETPDSLIVLGGGAIALEMAHYFEGIGRKVTVIQRGAQLLTGMDRDLAEVVRESFSRRMTVHTGTRLLRVERLPDGGGKRVIFEKNGAEHTSEAAEVLLALGRRAAVDGLDPGRAGVDLNSRGYVAVSGSMRTSAPHIFAAGDVCGEAEVVHVAIQQGELAARNAARLLRGEESGTEEMDYRLKLFGVFTEPQVAAAGMNEAAAAASGRPWKAASYPFNDHGKSLVMGETDGFVKMIADTETGEILGASVVGPEAVELIHTVCVAMRFRCTVSQFAAIPFYHPTLSEIWTYPAEDLM